MFQSKVDIDPFKKNGYHLSILLLYENDNKFLVYDIILIYIYFGLVFINKTNVLKSS